MTRKYDRSYYLKYQKRDFRRNGWGIGKLLNDEIAPEEVIYFDGKDIGKDRYRYYLRKIR